MMRYRRRRATGRRFYNNELHDIFRVWQPGTGSGTFQYGDNTGGYPAFRIRAVLNRYDWTSDSSHGNTTNLTRANQKYTWLRKDETSKSPYSWGSYDLTDIRTITSHNCLLSCFPENLRAAIVPKAVRSDTVYNDRAGNNVTTWDKLWLFSGKELYVNLESYNPIIRPNEGTIYDRIREKNIKTSTYAGNKGYRLDTSGSTTSDDTTFWVLRSVSLLAQSFVCLVENISWGDDDFSGNSLIAVAPGFVIGQ